MTEHFPSISTIRADVELAVTYIVLAFLIGLRPVNTLFTRLEQLLGIPGTNFSLFWCVIFLVAAYASLTIKPYGTYHALAALPLAIFGALCIGGVLLPSAAPLFMAAFFGFGLYMFFKNIRLQAESKTKDMLVLRLAQLEAEKAARDKQEMQTITVNPTMQ